MLENLSDVRIFVQVMESGGLTAAGRVLRMPTNQVSRRLARLEAALGARLLHRTTRRVTPTDDGRAFYARALRLLDQAREAEEEVGRASALEGALRVAVRTTSVEVGFVEEVTRLLLANPGLSLQLLVMDEQVDPVAAGLDLVVQVGSLSDSSAIARPVGQASYVLAASPDYVKRNGAPLSPADLVRHQSIRRHGSPPETEWTLMGPRGELMSVPIAGRFECSDSRAQAAAMREGLGIALRPAGEVREAAKAGRLVRVLPAWKLPPIPVWAVLSPGRTRLARVTLLVEALRKVIRQLA